VAEIVKPHGWHPRFLDRAAAMLRDAVAVERPAAAVGEHEPAFLRSRADGEAPLVLASAMRAAPRRIGVERDLPAAALRLRAGSRRSLCYALANKVKQ
jgi:hypothetical protein